jgi:hypothetical protein
LASPSQGRYTANYGRRYEISGPRVTHIYCPAGRSSFQSVLLAVKVCSVPGVCQFGSRSALIPRLEGLPSHQPFVKRVHFGCPGLTKSSTAPGEGRGHPAACTPPRETKYHASSRGFRCHTGSGTWPAEPEGICRPVRGSCGVNLHRYAPLCVEGSKSQERRRRRSSGLCRRT